MESKGLCTTCVELKKCIFSNGLPVWQCEEFSDGNYITRKLRQVSIKRSFSQETVTESE